MHVQPFFPARSCFIVPLASKVTIAASCANEAGAADSALDTGSLLEAAADVVLVSAVVVLVVVVAAGLLHAPTASVAPASSTTRRLIDVMNPSIA
jgi:hypothetical protein